MADEETYAASSSSSATAANGYGNGNYELDLEMKEINTHYFVLFAALLTSNSDETEELVRKLLSFSPNIFFMGLLPPIIFNSGYQLRRELFYRHISPITLFAAVGTTISALVCAGILWGVQQFGWTGGFNPTALELLAFGSLIAATDTVSVIAVLQAKRVDPQ
eukprot:scaffold6861_cov148-Amphora_coffeaeformis.AAC.1